MTKTVLTALVLTLAAGALSACVSTYPVRERVVIDGRGPWVPGHYDRYGAWIPGHYR
ncbi:MAG: hypothetical protein JSR98_02300 [Proteobacteria bacterium]|nr:hypothetical protein [Pseudomonadota bacterium]